jgi:hypothetical protein
LSVLVVKTVLISKQARAIIDEFENVCLFGEISKQAQPLINLKTPAYLQKSRSYG